MSKVQFIVHENIVVALVKDVVLNIDIEEWWFSKLGKYILHQLFECYRYSYKCVFFYNSTISECVYSYNYHKIFENIKKKYDLCNDIIIPLLDCYQCKEIIKIGNIIPHMKYSVTNSHICNECLYS